MTVARIQLQTCALFYIAERLGYFNEEGVDVEFHDFAVGKEALSDVIDGKSDLATVYLTPFVRRVYEGQDLVIFSALHRADHNTGIVARRDRGIEKPSDLAGKLVGVHKGTNAEFVLHLFLTSWGVDPSLVRTEDVPIDTSLEAIRDGKVDAVCVWNPFLSALLNSSLKAQLQPFYSDVYSEMSVLAGRSKLLPQKEDAIRRLLAGLLRAEAYRASNPSEAERIVNGAIPGRPALGSEGWSVLDLRLRLDHVLLTGLYQEADWMMEDFPADRPPPDFRSMINPNPLRAVQPDAITLFLPAASTPDARDVAAVPGAG